MPDTRQACESEYLTADLVKQLNKKEAVVIDGGEYEETQWGERLRIKVEVDGREKRWSINKMSAQNLSEEWGFNSDKWVGKVALLKVVKMQGKDSIVAIPKEDPTEEVK